MSKNKSVLAISLAIFFTFILIGVFMPEKLSALSTGFLVFASDQFGWFFMLSFTFFVAFCIYLGFSKYGSIRLGKDSDRPEFSTASWLAMLFSTSLAAAIFFWGVAEPVMHYLSPRFGEGSTAEAANQAMAVTFYHWGFHFWAVNCTIGVIMAYFHYRKGYPPLINYTLYPLLGNRVHGPIGKLVNILTIFAIVSGVTTSLGLGTRQLITGLNLSLGISSSYLSQSILFIILTICFLASAIYGLDRGIKRLSNINVVLGFFLMTFIFIFGPTNQILQTLLTGSGQYIQNIIGMSLDLDPFRPEDTWLSGWTIFYWGWIISFATFVGIFIARISKGRTIKEFVLGVMVTPAIASIIWFSVFGGSALHFIHNLGDKALADGVTEDVTSAFFLFLGNFPFSTALILLSLMSIIIFIITSADSTIFVLGMISEETDEPTTKSKVLWGIVIAAISITLIYIEGLSPLQSISVAAGLPFTVVALLMVLSFMKSLRQETFDKETILSENESDTSKID